MKRTGTSHPPERHDRLLHERVHDPYKTRLKLPEPTRCSQCGAVYQDGRWTWSKVEPESANEELCQACHRINDKYPAGELTMEGSFPAEHKKEILGLVHNIEEEERAEHPLHRIMEIREVDGSTLVTTTDIHLPRRIGQALHDAWEGELDMHYDEEGYFIRLHWRRDN
jgi:hypothetical protein